MKLFYKSKNINQADSKNLKLISVSVITMLICAVCLVGTSFAWFSVNVTAGVGSIEAAELKLSKLTVEKGGKAVELTEKDGVQSFSSSKNTVYEVTAKLKGSAKGYLYVETGDDAYYAFDKNMKFKICLSSDADVRISASWGEPSAKNAKIFVCGETLGSGKQALRLSQKGEATEKTTAEEITTEKAITTEAATTTEKVTTTEATTTTEKATATEATTTTEEVTTTEAATTTKKATTTEATTTTEKAVITETAATTQKATTTETSTTEQTTSEEQAAFLQEGETDGESAGRTEAGEASLAE